MIAAQAQTEISAGRTGVYLVTVRAGDVVARAATRPAEVPWANGVSLSYNAIAALEGLELSIDVASRTGIGSYQALRVELADESIDVVSLQLAGHPVAGAEVEVALWWSGQDWEQRQVVLSGRVGSPTVQGSGRLTGFTASAVPAMAGGEVVCSSARDVAGEYTTLTSQEHVGEAMPVVLGKVLNIPGIKVGTVASSLDHLLLAGHWFGSGGTVNVYEDGSTTAFAGSPYTVVNETSTTGTKVATLHAAAATTFQSAGALTVSCSSGGAPRVDGTGPTQTAADVLVWLLRKSGRRIDWRRMAQALVHLSTWEIGVYVDTETAAIDVISQGLLGVLPLVALEGGDGLWYHYADLDLRHPVADLVEGQNLLGPVAGGGIEWGSDEDCRNSFALAWSYDHADSEYNTAVVVDASSDPLCFLSRERVGVRGADPVETAVLWTARMARRSCIHAARRGALIFGTARLVVDPEVTADLEPGSTVLLTWTPWGLTRRPVIVRSTRPAADLCEISVTFVPCLTVRDGRL